MSAPRRSRPKDKKKHPTAEPKRKGLALFLPDGKPWLHHAFASVTLADGSRWSTRNAKWQRTAEGWEALAHSGGIIRPHGDLKILWRIQHVGDGFSFVLQVKNTGPHAICIRHIDVLNAQVLPRRQAFGALRARQTGYQSWSSATPQLALSSQAPLADGPIAGPWQPEDSSQNFWSPWCTVFSGEQKSHTLLGFLSSHSALGCIGLIGRPQEIRAVARHYGENDCLAPGEKLETEKLFLATGPDETKLLSLYAQESAQANAWFASKKMAPKGWCSWYAVYEDVDENLIQESVQILSARQTPIDTILLDDGYQTAIGDWLSVNKKFPNGLKYLTEKITNAGFQAGIWWAPFIAAENSALWREKPHWFLKIGPSSPVLALYNWNTRCFALDLSNPEVLEHLENTTRELVSLGFTLLKLDFLYAGALPGRRHQMNKSTVACYRAGLGAIRHGAPQAFLLGCGAPLLPSLGLVDGMRVSPDVAQKWHNPDPEGSAPSLENALRSTLARGWMQPHWWWNDPDCVLLSDAHTPSTRAERTAHSSAALLTGGCLFISDTLPNLTEKDWMTFETIVSSQAFAMNADTPHTNGIATRAWARAGDDDQSFWLALFNPSETSAAATFQPEEIPSLPPGPWIMEDIWQARTWTQKKAGPLKPLPRHSATLIKIKPALKKTLKSP